MKRRRVVITGLGVVSPNGIGKDAFWQNLLAGASAVRRVSSFDPSEYPSQVAAEVLDFKPEEFMHPRRARHRGRFSQFAVAAAKLALKDSGLDLKGEGSARAMVAVGTSLNGAVDVYEDARTAFLQKGVAGISSVSGVEFAGHAPASHISTELGIRGQAITLASACVTGLDAIQWGASQITTGHAEVVMAGGTDAPISRLSFAILCALGALSRFDGPPACASRPYDLHRDGLVLGEGASVVILEDLDHAVARGATIYAEALGFGSGNEGGFGPKADAAELALTDAISKALEEAEISPSAIDHINAHGNAMPDYDLIETRAFKRVFGRSAYKIPVTSIKSMIGHALGAASSFQVAAACLTLRHSRLSPTINLETADPECDLDYVPHKTRVARVRKVMINAHAMGGTHSVLILGAATP